MLNLKLLASYHRPCNYASMLTYYELASACKNIQLLFFNWKLEHMNCYHSCDVQYCGISWNLHLLEERKIRLRLLVWFVRHVLFTVVRNDFGCYIVLWKFDVVYWRALMHVLSISLEDSSALSLFPSQKLILLLGTITKYICFMWIHVLKMKLLKLKYFYPYSYKYLSVILRL